MLEKIEQEQYDILFNIEMTRPKHNQIWGADYLLMDSRSFMGGINVEEYEKIITMFMNIWNAMDYRILAK